MDIAIIDDNDMERKIITNYLRTFKEETQEEQIFQIVEFATAEELLWYQGNIDLLFMDIEIGEVNGTELAAEVRKRHSEKMIIVFIQQHHLKITIIQFTSQFQPSETSTHDHNPFLCSLIRDITNCIHNYNLFSQLYE